METKLNLPQEFDHQKYWHLIETKSGGGIPSPLTTPMPSSPHFEFVEDAPRPFQNIQRPENVSKDAVFPSLSCSHMWILWFHGDPPSGTRPFSTLRTVDLQVEESKRQWWMAKQLMAKLTDLARLHHLVPTVEALNSLSRDALLAVFEHAFEVFVEECGNPCGLTRDSSCADASKWISQAQHNMSRGKPKDNADLSPSSSGDYDDDESRTISLDPTESGNVVRGGRIPSLPCREMWRLWYIGKCLPHGIPYRLYRDYENKSTGERARRVMNTLSEIAVEEGIAPSKSSLESMAENALMDVFDQVFPIFSSYFTPDMQLAFNTMSLCGTINRCMIPTAYRRLRRVIKTPGLLSSPCNSSLDNQSNSRIFPSLPCREIWCWWFMNSNKTAGHSAICNWDNPVELVVTRRLIKALTAIATKEFIVSSPITLKSMARHQLLRIFDQVFPILRRRFADSHDVEPTTMGSVVSRRLVGRWWDRSKNKEEEADPPLVHVDADFPSVTARVMWLLWFRGDGVSNDIPYHHTTWSGGDSARTSSNELMIMLADYVVAMSLAPSVEELNDLSAVELTCIFDNAFGDFMAKYCPHCREINEKTCKTLMDSYIRSYRRSNLAS
ncbi:hypothetical protein AC1031_015163 [Aphanomyces cochlioides]|nr:hypothetical protein AC1031_015163 [Aphanomyces cochlioides]